jgi:hypothetical protein
MRFREFIQACCVLQVLRMACATTCSGAFEKHVSGLRCVFGDFLAETCLRRLSPDAKGHAEQG